MDNEKKYNDTTDNKEEPNEALNHEEPKEEPHQEEPYQEEPYEEEPYQEVKKEETIENQEPSEDNLHKPEEDKPLDEDIDQAEEIRTLKNHQDKLDEEVSQPLEEIAEQEEQEEFDIDLVGEAKERVSPVVPVSTATSQSVKPAPERKAKDISGGKLFTMLVAAVLVGALLSFSIFYAALPSLLQARGLTGTGNNGQSVVINPSSDLNVYSAVAEKAMPSVVGITTVQITEGFFSGTQRSQGVGTGVIVDERGYILTNSHVINDGQADEVTVLLHDGSHHTAQVLWYEQSMDLAVIKIDGGVNLIPAELGDSDALIVGEIVVAIGNPLGLNFERTLTQGVVSGLNRSIQVSASQIIDNLIQTDASINPGNSGGPLLNTQGQVIGINTAKMSSGEGLGFSIPINTAKPIVDQFIERGEFRRVYLGIRGFNARNVESATGIPLDVDSGVFVVEVVPGSAADAANLQAEDIVIALNGVEVDTMGSLIRELYKFRPGDQTTVTYLRGDEEFTVDITLTE